MQSESVSTVQLTAPAHPEDILAIVLGTATGLLVLLVLFLLHKLFNGGDKKYKKTRKSPNPRTPPTPTIIQQDIPGFMLPTCRNVRVQEPLRKTSGRGDEPFSDEFDWDFQKPRNNNNVPVSTIIASAQSTDFEEASKMVPVSPLKRKNFPTLRGSISLQELNVYSPKSRSRQSLTNDQEQVPSLKFALYYSMGTSELNVTVISIHNLKQLADIVSANLCVWVQVEFSRYHQEFRTNSCSCQKDPTFNQTCVVSDFPVEHFSGSKISFRVLHNDTTVVAEAVHIVFGLPPSFPRNESVELQHPGIVHTSVTTSSGEMLIRLKYDPVDENVTLGIVECRNLRSPKKKANKLLDTYVKVHIIFCNETVQKHKSKLIQKTNNPKFETRFNLAGFFSRAKMNQVHVKLTVVAKGVTNYRLGYVTLGTADQDNITASGYQHWETIIDKPELDIVQWHALKPMRSMTP